MLGAIGTPLVVRNDDGDIIVWNAAAERLLGWPTPDVLGRSLRDLKLAELDSVADEVATSGTSETLGRELQLECQDGRRVGVLVQVSRMDAGGRSAVVIVMSNLTEHLRADQRLQSSHEQAALLLQHSSDMVVVVNADGRVTSVNGAVRECAGYEPLDLVGSPAFDLVHPDDRARARDALQDVVAHECSSLPLTFRLLTKAGDHLWMDGRAVNLLHESSVRGVLVTLHDVTRRAQMESELSHRATHDALTGLPNRALFMDRLEHHLEHARRHDLLVAVLFWDVDNFKGVNDEAGHAVGDHVLVEVATRATAVMRSEDTVARLAGDEFVACAEVDSEPQVCALAERLLDAVCVEVTMPGGQLLEVTASVGVAYGKAPPADAVLLEADRAMYDAKRSGGRAITVLGVRSGKGGSKPDRPPDAARRGI